MGLDYADVTVRVWQNIKIQLLTDCFSVGWPFTFASLAFIPVLCRVM